MTNEELQKLLQQRVDALDEEMAVITQMTVFRTSARRQHFIDLTRGQVYELLCLAKYLGLEVNFRTPLDTLPEGYPGVSVLRENN